MKLWQGKNLRVAVVRAEGFRFLGRWLCYSHIANWHRTWRVGPIALVIYWPRRWERWMDSMTFPLRPESRPW